MCLLTKHRVLSKLPLILLIPLIAVAASVAAAQDPLRGWKVDAKTGALALVAVEESPRATTFVLTFVFRNVSGKTVTAWAFEFSGDGQKGRKDYRERFEGVTAGLLPGEVDRLSIGAEEALEYTDRTVGISAVIFADGTSEGSPRALSYMNHRRLGWMLETERIKRVLLVADERGRMDDADLTALAETVGRLPETVAEALASLGEERLPGVVMAEITLADPYIADGFLSGVQAARDGALRKLEELRNLPLSSSEPKRRTRASTFSRLRQEYEQLSAKHRAYCERLRGGTHQ